MEQQKDLFGEETKNCPKCKKAIMVWEVINKPYGFCNKCVKGFYF